MKKEYKSPVLEEYGSVETETMGFFGMSLDMGAGSQILIIK
jgi:hypothetical protein